MIAQLIFGIYFIIKGIVKHYSTKPSLFTSETITNRLSNEELSRYLKKVGKVYIAFGILVVTMGQIEHRYNPELLPYVITYIVLGLLLIGILFYFNKKYLGQYILR